MCEIFLMFRENWNTSLADRLKKHFYAKGYVTF